MFYFYLDMYKKYKHKIALLKRIQKTIMYDTKTKEKENKYLLNKTYNLIVYPKSTGKLFKLSMF